MVNFKKYLLESQSYDWAAYRSLGDKLDGHRKDKYLKAIDAFENGIKNKEIYNADFKDYYSYGFSRGLEDIWDDIPDHYSEKFDHTLFAINSINKLIKLSQNADVSKEAKHFLSIISTIPAMIKELKTYIKMGRKPNPNTEAAKKRFEAAFAHEDGKKVAETLKKSVEDIRSDYEKEFLKRYINDVKSCFSHKEEFEKEVVLKYRVRESEKKSHWYYGIKDPQDKYLVSLCIDLKTGDLKSDWKDSLEKQAKTDVNIILSGFVEKNTKKLTTIVTKKGNLKDIKIIHNYIRSGNLENEMIFTFQDGAHFTVYSKTVYKYSYRGKLFSQYPTRFTNIVNSDGTKMSAPNEEKMNQEFH